MDSFLIPLVFWTVVVFGGMYAIKGWRRRRALQPATQLKDLTNAEYYTRLSTPQFESLVLRALRAKGLTPLGDPWLGRSDEQGHIWRKARRLVLIPRVDVPPTLAELQEIEKQMTAVKAERALMFSPPCKTPRGAPASIELLSGRKLLALFSAIGEVIPPLIEGLPPQTCDCGFPMKERVNRAGKPMLICSHFPDCRIMKQATEPTMNPPPPSPLPPQRRHVRYYISGSVIVEIRGQSYRGIPVKLSLGSVAFKSEILPPAGSLAELQLQVLGFTETIKAQVKIIRTQENVSAAMFLGEPPASVVKCVEWLEGYAEFAADKDAEQSDAVSP